MRCFLYRQVGRLFDLAAYHLGPGKVVDFLDRVLVFMEDNLGVGFYECGQDEPSC